MTIYAITELHPGIALRIARGRRQYPRNFDASLLLNAPGLHEAFASQLRVEVDVHGDGSVIARGRVHTTAGPRPGFRLIFDTRDYSRGTDLSRRTRVLRTWTASGHLAVAKEAAG